MSFEQVTNAFALGPPSAAAGTFQLARLLNIGEVGFSASPRAQAMTSSQRMLNAETTLLAFTSGSSSLCPAAIGELYLATDLL